MTTSKPRFRPDSIFWNATREERKKLNLDKIDTELAAYSAMYFGLGRRFKLCKDFYGIPKDTHCTVIKVWPDTCIRWDKWARQGYGSTRRTRCMSYDLDLNLEEV